MKNELLWKPTVKRVESTSLYKFIKHVNTKPQIFKIFGNRLQKLNSDYKKYMLKQIINKFELYNQVVIIKYISNKNPFSRSNVAKKR